MQIGFLVVLLVLLAVGWAIHLRGRRAEEKLRSFAALAEEGATPEAFRKAFGAPDRVEVVDGETCWEYSLDHDATDLVCFDREMKEAIRWSRMWN